MTTQKPDDPSQPNDSNPQQVQEDDDLGYAHDQAQGPGGEPPCEEQDPGSEETLLPGCRQPGGTGAKPHSPNAVDHHEYGNTGAEQCHDSSDPGAETGQETPERPQCSMGPDIDRPIDRHEARELSRDDHPREEKGDGANCPIERGSHFGVPKARGHPEHVAWGCTALPVRSSLSLYASFSRDYSGLPSLHYIDSDKY